MDLVPSQYFNEIMPSIYTRFMEKEARQWRQIYKVRLPCLVVHQSNLLTHDSTEILQALQLLEYLIKHGSERVVDDARSHISTIKMLRNFHYIDDKGKDEGMNGGFLFCSSFSPSFHSTARFPFLHFLPNLHAPHLPLFHLHVPPDSKVIVTPFLLPPCPIVPLTLSPTQCATAPANSSSSSPTSTKSDRSAEKPKRTSTNISEQGTMGWEWASLAETVGMADLGMIVLVEAVVSGLGL
jgi:hypothetical protein